MKEILEYVGEAENYKVYRNSEGFLEGYKNIGGEDGDCKRVVSKESALPNFSKYVKGLNKRKVEPPPLKPGQLPSIFPPNFKY